MVEEVAVVLASMAELPYMLEPVDQLAHSLQTAGGALDSGADEELVVAALLHDIGRAPTVARVSRHRSHEDAGARWCSERFGSGVAWLVGAHVDAKRYLVGTDSAYRDALTVASIRSLRRQGGAMRAAAAARWAAQPRAGDALRLRRWDDAAKVPGAPAPSLKELFPVVEKVASPRP